ncbi:hypothetical protein [Polyangium sp. 15x6]|uniref:hypothetical protein n=1 Tax=Polyangium sp. 15x6 TaxID=3042687 RepID=UPI00249A8014|nr:hypothetical protein [Polyangium sp. 15x6]MDI3286607.1 hypothetical protein [Polyangium sp. 15x6]
MRTIALTAIVIVSTALPLIGCSSEPSDAGTAAGPTFHKDVAPILQKHCQSCHSPGQIASFSLIEYEQVKNLAGLIVMRTQDGTMPPWGAIDTDECTPRFGWQHDSRLSDAELATLEAWGNAGAPEGDPKDAPAGEPTKGVDLARVDLTLQPKKPFVASGEQDQLICFVLDPELTEDVYVSASKIVPGNLKVDHHGVVFVDPEGESLALANADGYYECFGSLGLEKSRFLTPWVPGAQPTVFPSNAGAFVPAGSKLVLQMHYHAAGTTADPDSTKVELQFHPGVPEYRAEFLPVAVPVPLPDGDGLQPGPDDANGIEFRIPAGAKAHTEMVRLTLPSEVGGQPLPEMKVYSVMNHMHYVGVDGKITVRRAAAQGSDPANECLLQTKWDFNWQQTYTYDATIENLPTLRGGDIIDVRCTYDNTLDNPFLKRALIEQHLTSPQDVTYGETTLDEMCVGILNTFVKN